MRRTAKTTLLFCTCSICGSPCTGERSRPSSRFPRVVVRVNGRPRCSRCVEQREPGREGEVFVPRVYRVGSES